MVLGKKGSNKYEVEEEEEEEPHFPPLEEMCAGHDKRESYRRGNKNAPTMFGSMKVIDEDFRETANFMEEKEAISERESLLVKVPYE